MTPEMLLHSLQDLLSCYPEFRPLPSLSEGSAKKVTFIGFSFPLNGKVPVAKLYFVPENRTENLPAEIPAALRRNMQQAAAVGAENHLRLYDASLEQSGRGGFIGRLLWAIPSGKRASGENFPHTVRRLLERLGHPALALPLLRINDRLQGLLQTGLAPFYHLGGFLGEDGSMVRIKANFDADICGSNDHIRYDAGRSEAATGYLLKEFGCPADLSDRILFWNRILQQNGYFTQFWGIHAAGSNLESMKIYLKDASGWSEDARMVTCRILSGFMGKDAVRLYPIWNLLLRYGWKYYGFYFEFTAGKLNAIKLYFHTERTNSSDEVSFQ